jgi:hypothetical protein
MMLPECNYLLKAVLKNRGRPEQELHSLLADQLLNDKMVRDYTPQEIQVGASGLLLPAVGFCPAYLASRSPVIRHKPARSLHVLTIVASRSENGRAAEQVRGRGTETGTGGAAKTHRFRMRSERILKYISRQRLELVQDHARSRTMPLDSF